MTYESSVLRCEIGEDGCAICSFLAGKEDRDTMLEVIRVLDLRLAEEENILRGIMASMVKKSHD
jgi:hypothetical protein